MMRKRIIGLIGTAFMFLALAAPLSAAEKTYQFDIPGCTS